MGSFLGHIDEAIFFLLIATWWMCWSFPRYIRASWSGSEFRSQLSYTLPCRPSIPIEAILKTLFPLCGFTFEVAFGGNFLDDNGNFRKLNQMQHMTIYGMFVLHGILDILQNYRVPILPHSEYLSAAASFAWYGTAFGYHANMHGKEGMEKMAHVQPICIIFLAALCFLLEAWKRTSFMVHVMRIYSVLVLGTYFIHMSFVMYLPSPFPGNLPNPKWKREDMRNANALVSVFGLHLCLHLVTITVTYLLVLYILRAKGEHHKRFLPLNTRGEESTEQKLLLTNDEEAF